MSENKNWTREETWWVKKISIYEKMDKHQNTQQQQQHNNNFAIKVLQNKTATQF